VFVLLWLRTSVVKTLTMLAVTMLPATVYFGWSYAVTGFMSTSAAGRAFYLRQNAPQLFGLSYATSPLLVALGLLPWLILAALGARYSGDAIRCDAMRCEWLRLFAPLVFVGYLLLLTIASPVFYGGERYLLPAVPPVFALASRGVADLIHRCRREEYPWRAGVVACALGLILMVPRAMLAGYQLNQPDRRMFLNDVVLREVADVLNVTAGKGSVVLTYEPQIRFVLRPDLEVLSMDGITDGKIVPYLDAQRVMVFLRQARPQYWIYTPGVFAHRCFLDSPLLFVEESTWRREGDSVRVEGIEFTNVAVVGRAKYTDQTRDVLERGVFNRSGAIVYRLRF
jgi:hypothetical protein